MPFSLSSIDTAYWKDLICQTAQCCELGTSRGTYMKCFVNEGQLQMYSYFNICIYKYYNEHNLPIQGSAFDLKRQKPIYYGKFL